jgi:uncharacterized membrane protein
MEFLIILAVVIAIIFSFVSLTKSGEALDRVHYLEKKFEHEKLRSTQLDTDGQRTSVVLPPERKPSPPLSMEPPPLPELIPSARSIPHAPVNNPPAPPPIPLIPRKPSAASYESKVAQPGNHIEWEKFLGVKLFSWIGGLALFLGIVFFVKYAFENNLIAPATRVGLGFGIGILLLSMGPLVRRWKDYTVLTQSLCATGVVTLYGVTYAAHAYYSLPAFTTTLTFFLLVIITGTAFGLAVRMNARVVAVLGMLGGFLTPLAVSTGQDRPLALFGYIALLDLGLMAVVLKRPWRFLMPSAAFGTMVIQVGWMLKFFGKGNYAEGSLTLVPMGMFLGFLMLFGGLALGRRKEASQERLPFCDAALILGASALGFAGFSLHWEGIGLRPWLAFGYVAIVEILVFLVAWRTPARAWIASAVGIVSFLLLGLWSVVYLTPELLTTGLMLYVAFGLLGVLAPLLWNRYGPRDPDQAVAETPWITPLAIAMCGLPLLLHPHTSGGIWLAVLCLNLTGLALAKHALGQLCQAVATAVTLMFSILWLAQLPMDAGTFETWLCLLGGLAVFLLIQGGVMQRRSARNELSQGAMILAVAWPFLLLAWAEIRLPLTSPHLLFGASSVLGAVLLATAWWRKNSDLALLTYLGTFVVQALWMLDRPVESNASSLLCWQAGFGLLYFSMPFLRPSLWSDSTKPWVASGLALLLQALLMYVVIRWSFPSFSDDWMGLLPAGYAVLAGVSVWLVTKQDFPEDKGAKGRVWRLAWFGGIALYFFTAIVPLQFHRQWITISWAMEGAALIWLFGRVPHRGLLQLGYGLLVGAFVWLAVNPDVLEHTRHQPTPIWNWLLYAYGTSAAAMFAAARWWPTEITVLGARPRSGLFLMMGITLFALVNLEIADYFTPAADTVISFDFAGNLARDVCYSIAWALFGLGCLVLGFWHHQRGPRYAGLGLLAVTLLKLFFHDLAQVQSVYRIVALIAVALIVLVASFLYQRFFASAEGQSPTEGPMPSEENEP